MRAPEKNFTILYEKDLTLEMKTLCVITGASSGIGRSVAMALSKENTHLILNARREDELLNTKRMCEHDSVDIIAGDISQEETVILIFNKFEEIITQQKPDHLRAVFCAGYAKFGDTLQFANEHWKETIDVNLNGLFYCCKHACNAMLQHGGGRVFNILSIASKSAFSHSTAYVASKFGALGLTKSLNEEFRNRGVHFCAIMPGSTDTPLWSVQQNAPPLDEMMNPEELGNFIANLALQTSDIWIDEILITPKKGIL